MSEAPELVDGLQGRPEQYRRFLIARGPSAVAIHALPGDVELLVNQHDRLGAPATGTRHSMPMDYVLGYKSSLHVQLLGTYKPMR